MTLSVSAFYKFVELPDFRALRDPLLAMCRDKGIRGTILLAPEGINGNWQHRYFKRSERPKLTRVDVDRDPTLVPTT